LFKWAQGRGIERSPLDGYDAAPAPAPSRDRVLTDDELRLAWLAAGKLGQPFADFYRVLIGTGQRREEVASLDWKELNRDAAEWRLPSERSKNNEPHTVPLASLVFDLFDQLAEMAEVDAADRKWPKRGLVFSTTGKTAVSGYSRAKRRLDAAMLKLALAEAEEAGEDPETVSVDPWRVHDIRRTVATGLQRLGVRFEVTEAVLNHVSGRSRSGIAAVYQRHQWTEEKRSALNAWAGHVERLLSAGEDNNVVPIRAGDGQQ
jgi:integrase